MSLATNNNQRPAEPRREEIVAQEEPASNAQIREMDSIVSAMEADVTTGCDFFTRSNGKCLFSCNRKNKLIYLHVSFF